MAISSLFFINLPTEFFHFPIHVAIGDFHASVYPPLLHSLIVYNKYIIRRYTTSFGKSIAWSPAPADQ
jgi:hypothetical protein